MVYSSLLLHGCVQMMLLLMVKRLTKIHSKISDPVLYRCSANSSQTSV